MAIVIHRIPIRNGHEHNTIYTAIHIMLFNNYHEFSAIRQQSWTIYLDVHTRLM